MNRRDFIHWASLLCAGSVFSLGDSAWAVTAGGLASTQRKLVVIMLRGAVDGLSIVVPYGDANYYRVRPDIAILQPGQTNGALDLDGYFGLHPALISLQPLWQQGKLAFVHASGSPNPSRSHFDAQDYMESGTPGVKHTPDGWMNRLLSELPGVSAQTRGICVGPVVPRILSGRASVANIASGNAAMRPTVLDRPRLEDAFSKLYQNDEKLGQVYQEALGSHREVMSSMAGSDEEEMIKANGGAPLPHGFPQDAARLATLMRRDPNVQIAFMALGGWDTHAHQGSAQGQLANHLEPLGRGLATLVQHLDTLFYDTTVVVMSEFGRTVHQNGNHGTDHGHGNVMWVLGGRVKGGQVAGQWEGLDEAHLYQARDVPVTTDFRDVLAQVMERHLGMEDSQLQRIFPEFNSMNKRLKLI